MSQHTYQIVWLVLLSMGFALTLVRSLRPTEKAEADGCAGMVGTLIRYVIIVWLLVECGTFSTLLGGGRP